MAEIDLTSATWAKSSFSQQGGDCIEVAADFLGIVPVRDSKDPEGPALLFPTHSFSTFIAGVKAGEFGSI